MMDSICTEWHFDGGLNYSNKNNTNCQIKVATDISRVTSQVFFKNISILTFFYSNCTEYSHKWQ